MEEKRPFFVESSDSDIRKLVGMLFQKLQRRQKNTNQRGNAKNAKYFGALQKFSLHHNLPSFDLIPLDI